MTTKGEPISHDIRYAKNRNEALAAMMMNAFDKFLKTAQQSKTFRTAAREMPQRAIALRRAVEMAETFAENGQSGLIEALVEFCCAKAGTPRTRLGNVRKRLSHQRSGSPELDEADSALEGLLNQAVALDEEEESAKTQTALA